MVEAVIVQTADVGHEPDFQCRRVVLGRGADGAREDRERRDGDHGHRNGKAFLTLQSIALPRIGKSGRVRRALCSDADARGLLGGIPGAGGPESRDLLSLYLWPPPAARNQVACDLVALAQPAA